MTMVETIRGGFISLSDIKEIEFHSNEMDKQVTIGEWLQELLCRVWMEKESFSGKYAFRGVDDWSCDIYETLYHNGIINGSLMEYGEVEITKEQLNLADKIILDIILNEM